MFSLLMGIARFLRSRVNVKTSIFSLMIGCGALCAASYLLAALAPHPALALLGCGLCGFSVGILWPGVYSMAGELCPTGGTAMFAFLALAGDIGSSGGPTLIGLIAGSHGDDLSLGMLCLGSFSDNSDHRRSADGKALTQRTKSVGAQKSAKQS